MITITEQVEVTEEPPAGSSVYDRYGDGWFRLEEGPKPWSDFNYQPKYSWKKLMKKVGPLQMRVEREVTVIIPTDEEVASGYARGGPFLVAGGFMNMAIRREEFRLWLQKHDEELWAKRNNLCADLSLPKGEVADYGGRALAARGEGLVKPSEGKVIDFGYYGEGR